MSAAGIFAGIAQGVEKDRDQKRQDTLDQRNRQADVLVDQIKTIESQPLSPDDPKGEHRAAIVADLQNQLKGLYQPHEGPDLFKRLGKLVRRGQPTGASGGAGESLGLPTGTQAVSGAPSLPTTGPISRDQIMQAMAPQPGPAPKPTYQQTDQGLMAITSNPDGSTTANPVLYNGEPLKGVKQDEGVLKELEDGSLVRIVGTEATPITQDGKPVKGEKKPGPKETPDEKMIAIDSKIAQGQELTPEETGYQAGYLAHQKEKGGTTESTSKTTYDDMGNPVSTSRASKKVYPGGADTQKSGSVPVQQKDGPKTKTASPPKAATVEDAHREAANGNVVAQEAIDWAEKGTKPTGNARGQSMVRKYMAAHGMSPAEKPEKESPEAVKAKEAADVLDVEYKKAREREKDRTPLGDLGLVFSWVRAQVAGGGRMTNTEIEQGLKAGSFGTRFSNAYNKAISGTLDDGFVHNMVTDIGVATRAADAKAAEYPAKRGVVSGVHDSSGPSGAVSDDEILKMASQPPQKK